MFSLFRSKQSPRETWLQIYAMHVQMGLSHDQAVINAAEAVRESCNYNA